MIVWLLFAVLASVAVSGAPEGRRSFPREARIQYARTIATSILSRTPPGARLIGARGDLPPLVDRLVHNATSIRLNIVDTFNCSGRVYGYYADQDNDCQIFHICVPMQQLFPDLYEPEDIFQFSFICPGYTIFSQDSMTCDWQDSAFPCLQAPFLYHLNNHFFVVPSEDVQKTSPSPSPSPSPDSSTSLDPSPSPSPNTKPSPSPSTSPIPSPSTSPSPSPTPNTIPSPSPTPETERSFRSRQRPTRNRNPSLRTRYRNSRNSSPSLRSENISSRSRSRSRSRSPSPASV